MGKAAVVSQDPDALKIMRAATKTLMEVIRERPDLEIDPNLPLMRKEHPEWFDDRKPQ